MRVAWSLSSEKMMALVFWMNAGLSKIGTYHIARQLLVLEGLIAAIQQGVQSIHIESDSKILVDILADKSSSPWRIRNIVGNIFC